MRKSGCGSGKVIPENPADGRRTAAAIDVPLASRPAAVVAVAWAPVTVLPLTDVEPKLRPLARSWHGLNRSARRRGPRRPRGCPGEEDPPASAVELPRKVDAPGLSDVDKTSPSTVTLPTPVAPPAESRPARLNFAASLLRHQAQVELVGRRVPRAIVDPHAPTAVGRSRLARPS